LELRRGFSQLIIYLPLGSPEGAYEVRIVTASGDSLAIASGVALGVCCALSLQIKAQSVPPLSMAEAIQLALAHNRSIQMTAVDVKRADAEI
jgi:hypothetical protein